MQPPIQELHNFDPHLWVYDKAKMLQKSRFLQMRLAHRSRTWWVASSTSHSLWAAALSLKS